MSALATLAAVLALVALTRRITRRRDYGADAPANHPERARRRSGRVFFGCWKIA